MLPQNVIVNSFQAGLFVRFPSSALGDLLPTIDHRTSSHSVCVLNALDAVRPVRDAVDQDLVVDPDLRDDNVAELAPDRGEVFVVDGEVEDGLAVEGLDLSRRRKKG